MVSNDLKYPSVEGRPNSLLNAAAPIGASIIMFNGDAILSGFLSSPSQLLGSSGIEFNESLIRLYLKSAPKLRRSTSVPSVIAALSL